MPALGLALFAPFALSGCSAPPVAIVPAANVGPARIVALTDRAMSWRVPPADDEIAGLRLLYDTPVPGGLTLAIVRSAVRANHRLGPFDALVIATEVVASARRHGLPPGFIAATLLQESAFDPAAVSPAGAVGIAQFTLGTAADEGVDATDWADSVGGCTRLLARYVAAYDGRYPDPYAAALAAYNAGPGTVAYYGGVPPYAETRAYVADIYDRWARLLRDGDGSRSRRPAPAVRTM